MHVILILSAYCEPLEIGMRDCDRPISEEGQKDIVDDADFINRLGIIPEIVLTSPFKRAKDTGDIFAANFKESLTVEIVPDLMPGAGPEELIRAITNRTSCDSKKWLAVVIHQSDTDLIMGSLLGEKNKSNFFLQPGMIIGVDIECVGGNLSGRILFSRYPGNWSR